MDNIQNSISTIISNYLVDWAQNTVKSAIEW